VRVGLNLVYLVPGETGGRETYARELTPRLAELGVEPVAFVNREAFADPASPWRDLGPMVRVPVSGRSRAQWAAGEQLLLPHLAAKARIDLLHSPANFAPAWGPFARVTTLHDLLYLRYPQFHGRVMYAGTKLLVPLGARRSHRLLTGSAAARDDLNRLLRLPSKKIDVVPHGIGASGHAQPTESGELRRRFGLGERHIALSVATRLRHKNLIAAVEAAPLLPPGERPLFVFAGGSTLHDRELEQRARELGVEEDVRLLARVPAADLEGLYRAAACLVFPSLYEGFGLPVLEAMERGLPVACSDIPVLREVAGVAALLFDPNQPATLAAAVRTLLADSGERERLRRAGKQRAARFTWQRAAEGTLASFERALAERRGERVR
jgi:glycosyltransferase involved in cell wall biosynthesis